MNKWLITFAATTGLTGMVWLLPFMHSYTAIIVLLAILLFVVWLVKESREEKPAPEAALIDGLLYAVYISFILLSALLYFHLIPLDR